MTWSRLGLPAVIVLIALTFSVLNPNFYSAVNLRNVARQSAILSLTACGQTMVVLSGGFDLSVGMVMGLISVADSLVMVETGLWTGMLAGVLMGAGIGAINGGMVATMHLPPFIATLAMLSAARGLALILSGGLPITDLPLAFRWLGAGQVLTLPLPAVIAAIAFVGCHLLMKKPALRPVRLRDRWQRGGRDIHRRAGRALQDQRVELESIAATMIGGTTLGRGRGGIGNTLLGVLAMRILTNGLNLVNVSTYYQMVAMGVIIAGAVYVDQWRHRER